MKQNPVEDLQLLHCDLVMAAETIGTVIEAAMSGECTPVNLGNSLVILKEYIDNRLDILEKVNGILHDDLKQGKIISDIA